jgi:hypothetical protein
VVATGQRFLSEFGSSLLQRESQARRWAHITNLKDVFAWCRAQNCRPAGLAIDNREPSPSATAGLGGGWGASLSRLGYFGGSQAEGAPGC